MSLHFLSARNNSLFPKKTWKIYYLYNICRTMPEILVCVLARCEMFFQDVIQFSSLISIMLWKKNLIKINFLEKVIEYLTFFF